MDRNRQRMVFLVVVVILCIVGGVAVYWKVSQGPVEGPAPPPQASGIRVSEFTCNGQDVLANFVKVQRSSAISINAKAIVSEQIIEAFAKRPICTLFIVDEREIICQSRIVNWELHGDVLVMTCATTSPSMTGSFILRIVAARPRTGEQITLCEGKLTGTD